MSNPQGRRRLVLLLGIGVEGGLAGLAWLLGWILDQPAAATLHWRPWDAVLGIGVSLPMLAGFFLCVRWPVGPLARIKEISDELVRPFFAACTLLDLALISLAAGLGEELLFRGVLQAALARWLGLVPGMLLASVVFGLLHWITPTYALLATLLGVYLGCTWLAGDNLLVVVVAHAFYDFVALTYLVRRRPVPN
jgi:uncharacterized protein